MAAEMGHDHPVARRRQQWGDLDEAVDVVRPSVQQEHWRTAWGTRFGVADVEDPGMDLLERSKRRARARLARGSASRLCLAGLRGRRTQSAEPGGGNSHGCSAHKGSGTQEVCAAA